MPTNEYECAVTGAVELGGQSDDSDKLDDLPVGWTKITIARRQYNPKWMMIQQVKESMISGLLSQAPDLPDVQKYAVSLQVDAQFHAMEKDTPLYIRDVDDVVYISDAGEILETINEIRESLGLEELGEGEEDEADEADESDLPHDGEVGDQVGSE